MENATSTLDSILYGALQPWLHNNLPDESYAPKFASLPILEAEVNLKYEINFQRPANAKSKFYNRLITNSIAESVSEIIKLMNEDDDEDIILCWIDDVLHKKLKTRLLDIADLLIEKDYSSAYLRNTYVPQPSERNHHTNTFIMQLLKIAYMQIYLEVQEEFKRLINDPLIPEDFYLQFFREPVPDVIPLKKIITVEVEQVISPKKEIKTNATEINVLSFSYINYDKGNEKLADAFDRLKAKGFIHKETKFPDFKRIFSGKEITKPVRWTGNSSELYYFIKLLYQEHKLLKNLKQKQWRVAGQCFINADGDKFDMKKVKALKRPELSADALEFIVSMMK